MSNLPLPPPNINNASDNVPASIDIANNSPQVSAAAARRAVMQYDQRTSVTSASSNAVSHASPTARVRHSAAGTNSNSAPTTSSTGSRSRGKNFTQDELLNLFSIMEDIKPIGPDEWEKVVNEHSVMYPGRDVDSICRKFINCHRKKVPTGDPDCPEEIRLAKRVKYLIGDRANLGGGQEEYDMETNRFDTNVADDDSMAVAANPIVPPVVNQSNVIDHGQRSLNGISARSLPKKIDFMEMMMLQMQQESAERAFERKERAEDRRHMSQLLTTLATGYMMVNGKKKKKKKKHKKKRRNNATSSILSTSSSSSSSSSSN